MTMKIPTPTMQEPERIAKLPHWRGLPITATTEVDPATGIPNFKSVDGDKVWQFKQERKCAICGEALDYWIAFMVTEDEATSRHIFESPQHKECLEYAFQVCPWLYWSKAMYTPVETVEVDGRIVSNALHPDRLAGVSQRPEKLGIYVCRSYENVIVKPYPQQPAYRVCKAAPARSIEWIQGN